jgi:hypothetical protein
VPKDNRPATRGNVLQRSGGERTPPREFGAVTPLPYRNNSASLTPGRPADVTHQVYPFRFDSRGVPGLRSSAGPDDLHRAQRRWTPPTLVASQPVANPSLQSGIPDRRRRVQLTQRNWEERQSLPSARHVSHGSGIHATEILSDFGASAVQDSTPGSTRDAAMAELLALMFARPNQTVSVEASRHP